MGILDAPALTRAQGASLVAGVVNASSVAATPPKFYRANGGNPIFTQAAQNPAPTAATPTTSNSIYFPWIVDARLLFGTNALDEYYLYYSTDHEGTHANSGIWLATGPTPAGPWTGRGRVYIDNAGGTQTETPAVFADPTGASAAIMLYQQAAVPGAVGAQTTLYATSPDGITWTRGGIAIDIPTWWPSDGHTGYARPRDFGGKLIAWHLAGGWDYPTFGRSTSYDGRTWWLDRFPLPYQMDLVADGRRVEWNSGDVILWNGIYWWIGMLSDFVSGATPKNARLAIAPLSNDLRLIVAKPQYLLYPTQGSETTNYRALKTFAGRDGVLYLYYQCGNSFYVASTKAS